MISNMAAQLPSGQSQTGPYPEAIAAPVSHSSGSIGPFFAVLAVITVLAALSCVFGRIFVGGSSGTEGRYDCVRWMESRCKSCIEGEMDVHDVKQVPMVIFGERPGIPAVPVEAHREGKVEGGTPEQQQQQIV